MNPKAIFRAKVLELIKKENLEIDDKVVGKAIDKVRSIHGTEWKLKNASIALNFYYEYYKKPKEKTEKVIEVVEKNHVLVPETILKVIPTSLIEKDTKVRDTQLKKSGLVKWSADPHNIQVQFDNGEIRYYCIDRKCKNYNGNVIGY